MSICYRPVTLNFQIEMVQMHIQLQMSLQMDSKRYRSVLHF